jgi:hypothetical protein
LGNFHLGPNHQIKEAIKQKNAAFKFLLKVINNKINFGSYISVMKDEMLQQSNR